MTKAKPAAKKTKFMRNCISQDGKLQHVPWDRVEMEVLNPRFRRQFVIGKNVMLSRIFLKKGNIVPLHHHHNEQLSYVLKGRLRFFIDGRRMTVKTGEVLIIPPHMPHRVEALMDTLSLDIFDPPREDWINKTDLYLRGGE